jgi:hypothetical protein
MASAMLSENSAYMLRIDENPSIKVIVIIDFTEGDLNLV